MPVEASICMRSCVGEAQSRITTFHVHSFVLLMWANEPNSKELTLDIVSAYDSSLFAVCAAEILRVVGNVDVVLFEKRPFVEDWNDRGLKLGTRMFRHGLSCL